MDDPLKIPEFRLIAEPVSEEARLLPPFKWADPEMGKRHKIGGSPDFIQELEAPICPSCQRTMSFYAQLDSINDEYCLADCGMIYVHVCFDCFTSHSSIHSY